jgi:NADH-ubiquinone oxidoreductase chain 2
MTGIPPLVGFFSKQFVLLSAVESKYYFMAFIAIFTSVISASYYIRFFITLISSPADIMSASLHPTEVLSNKSILTNYHSYIISTLTLSILTFIFKPTLILNSTQLLSLSYFYI